MYDTFDWKISDCRIYFDLVVSQGNQSR